MPALHMDNIRKSYGTLCVLDGVSLHVEPQEVVAVIGRSGSGKSTMLRCINGLEKIQEGSITVAGHRIGPEGGDVRALRREVGMVFQSYNLFPHLSVMENIMLAPTVVNRVSKKEAERTGDEVLAQVGLSSKRDAYPDAPQDDAVR
jgi:polar amino acid transport system ATP-binding protein